jgi:hypothetical protein
MDVSVDDFLVARDVECMLELFGFDAIAGELGFTTDVAQRSPHGRRSRLRTRHSAEAS